MTINGSAYTVGDDYEVADDTLYTVVVSVEDNYSGMVTNFTRYFAVGTP